MKDEDTGRGLARRNQTGCGVERGSATVCWSLVILTEQSERGEGERPGGSEGPEERRSKILMNRRANRRG